MSDASDLRLVELADDDFGRMLEGASMIRPEISAPPGGVDSSETIEHVREIARRLRAADRCDSWMMVAGGEAVGMIGYHGPPSVGRVEIGYGVAGSRRRRGFATAAVRETVAIASRDPSILTMVAVLREDNEASRRALERNGFVAGERSVTEEDGEVISYARHLSPFAGLDHVQLAMPPGEERLARAFYTDVLGFDEIPKPPELAARGGAWFRSGSAALHLGVEADFRPARKAHPALRCRAYEAVLARLSAFGVPVVDDGSKYLGAAHCYVDDPFGNRIELIAG